MEIIKLRDDYIKLGQAIKAANLVGSGVEAKFVIQDGLVKVNGQYYYLDATWGDASYLTESGNGDALATINYDYLCITTQDILQTHTIDNPIPVPNCIVMLDNYYVKEGLYISSIDGMVMEKIFKEL